MQEFYKGSLLNPFILVRFFSFEQPLGSRVAPVLFSKECHCWLRRIGSPNLNLIFFLSFPAIVLLISFKDEKCACFQSN